MRRHYIFILSLFIICMAGAGCGHRVSGTDLCPGDTVTSYASLLTIEDGSGWSRATVLNPWDTTQVLGRYVLVERCVPEDSARALAGSDVLVRTPLERSVVYTGVHGGVIAELGRTDAIAAVAESEYFRSPDILAAIAGGRISDVGQAVSPSVEKIVDADPDAILLSPYQNSGHGAIATLGIAILEMADYMESTPLGRAEWIKFLGRLYGEGAKADSIFAKEVRQYGDIAAEVRAGASFPRPKVLMEQPYSGVWAVPAGGSYMARMLADACVDYPWADTRGTGSVELSVESVLDGGEDADYWLIRSYGPLSLTDLRSNVPLASHFKAFRDSGVRVCNTAESALYDEFPFHPHLLLREFAVIFHPDLYPGISPVYFHPQTE